jgi:hypothetical protein
MRRLRLLTVIRAGFRGGRAEGIRCFLLGSVIILASDPVEAFESAMDSALLHEVDGGVAASVAIPSVVGASARVAVAGGYQYRLWERLQLGGEVTSLLASGLTSVQVMAGPCWNFLGDDLVDSYFIALRAGPALTSVSGLGSSLDVAYSAALGKRFALSASVVWRPEASVTGTSALGTYPQLNLVPLRFSFFL